jgi:DNA-binding transcriptional LysR family regulator
MPLERRDLQLVRAIGEAGTLLGGARKLGIDHSTAFRRLNALEAQLGVRLFIRARDGYAPTAAGEAMIDVAAQVDADIVALERRLAGADLRPSGTVRVTITDTSIGLLTPVFAAFREAEPDIDLEVAIANQFFVLSKREADVAIRPSVDVPENLVARRIATVATAVYASLRHAARASRTLRARGLRSTTACGICYRRSGSEDGYCPSVSCIARARWSRCKPRRAKASGSQRCRASSATSIRSSAGSAIRSTRWP